MEGIGIQFGSASGFGAITYLAGYGGIDWMKQPPISMATERSM